MTAPGGNFFSKSSRRAAKAGIEKLEDVELDQERDPALQKDMDLVGQPAPKKSGFQTVHIEEPGAKAKAAVRAAEEATERKHGKMKR